MTYLAALFFLAVAIGCSAFAGWHSLAFAAGALVYGVCGVLIGYFALMKKPVPLALKIFGWILAVAVVAFVVIAFQALSSMH
ncbi:MAG: hypothetical protein HKN18_14265 [Silicimonas sp.]|nr:hypothetical protein [Silicimonas sp.]